MATYSTTPLSATTYYTKYSATTLTITAFTSTESDALCGVFIYSLVNSDSSPIDTSVFTYNSGAFTLTIQTNNIAKVGVYNMLFKGYQGIYSSLETSIAI